VCAALATWACECGALIHFENGRADCAACGRKYEMKKENTVKEI